MDFILHNPCVTRSHYEKWEIGSCFNCMIQGTGTTANKPCLWNSQYLKVLVREVTINKRVAFTAKHYTDVSSLPQNENLIFFKLQDCRLCSTAVSYTWVTLTCQEHTTKFCIRRRVYKTHTQPKTCRLYIYYDLCSYMHVGISLCSLQGKLHLLNID
jgi:hypothetical protein